MAEHRSSHSSEINDVSVPHELLKRLLDASPDSIAVLDTHYTLKYINRSGARRFGSTPEKLIGTCPNDLLPPEVAEFRKAQMAHVVETGERIQFEDDRNGICLENSLYPIKDQSGDVIAVTVFSVDVTERKKIAQALRDSEAKLSNASHIAHLGPWEYDVARDLFTFNDEFYSMLRTSVDKVGGYTMSSADYASRFVHPEDRAMVGDEVRMAIETDDPDFARQLEHRIIYADGEVGYIMVRFFVEKNEQGETTRTYGVNQDITERKQAEEELRTSKRIIEGIIDAIPVRVFWKNLDLVYLGCNSVFARDAGYSSPDEIVGKNDSQMSWSKQASLYRVDDLQVIESGRPKLSIEEPQTTPDGQTVTLLTSKLPLRNDAGDIVGVIGTYTDITGRKKAEETLLENQKRYERAQEIGRVGNWEYNPVTTKFWGSDEARRIYGLDTDDEDFTTERVEDCIPEKERVHQALVDLIEHDQRYDIVFDIITADKGIRKTIHSIAEIERDSQGNAVKITGVVSDITQRKAAEERIGFLSQVTEQVTDAVLTTDLNFTITYVNKAFQQLYGYSREEMLGKTPDILNADPNARDVQEELYRTVSSGRTWSGEIENRKKDNTVFLCEASVYPIKDDEGNIFAYAGSQRDITETKRLRELESRAERLEAAGTIAGQVAHDFNNLLAPLIAYPEFIRETLPEDHPALDMLVQIEEAARKIADINQQLLTLSRRGHYIQEVLDLNTIVQQAISDMGKLPGKVSYETDLDPELARILGGGSQIHRVVTNLLYNAVDALQNIGHIHVRTENYYVDDVSSAYGRVPMGEYVKLTVSDNGCGMSDDIVQKVLDPFFTTKTSDRQRGSGLGLSIVDAVIKDHGGYLDLKTRPGKGTSFYVYLPMTRELLDEGSSEELSGGTESILVVDDDEIQREVSTQLLSKLGYQVRSCDSGESAVEFLRENPHDLVILDMIMPGGIDGAETYRRILEMSSNQKTIIVSGFSETERVNVAQKLGAGAFVKKPLTRKAIADAARKELDREVKSSLT